MTTAFTPTWMPCVVTHSRSSSASWMSSESRRTFCRPGTTNAPLPTTILKPRPAASPSGPWCARTPEMMSASFGSATLYMNMTACSFLGSVALGERAHDDRPGRLVLEHDDAGAALDALLLVGGVREVRLAAAADRDHHLTELARLDGAGDAAHLPDQLVVGDHPRLSFHQTCAHFVDCYGVDAGSVQVLADPAVATLELLQDGDHRLGRSVPDPPAPLPLEVVLGRRDPLRRPLAQVGPAQGVVGADRLGVDADESEQQRDDESGAVLAAVAVDDDRAFRCSGDRCDCRAELRAAPLEELQVDGADRAGGVGLRVPGGVDLDPFLVVDLGHERHVHDLDGQISRRIESQLAVESEI